EGRKGSYAGEVWLGQCVPLLPSTKLDTGWRQHARAQTLVRPTLPGVRLRGAVMPVASPERKNQLRRPTQLRWLLRTFATADVLLEAPHQSVAALDRGNRSALALTIK